MVYQYVLNAVAVTCHCCLVHVGGQLLELLSQYGYTKSYILRVVGARVGRHSPYQLSQVKRVEAIWTGPVALPHSVVSKRKRRRYVSRAADDQGVYIYIYVCEFWVYTYKFVAIFGIIGAGCQSVVPRSTGETSSGVRLSDGAVGGRTFDYVMYFLVLIDKGCYHVYDNYCFMFFVFHLFMFMYLLLYT